MLLTCQNVNVTFGAEEVLKSVSFNMDDGDKIAVVGINGAGKTTLLNAILGKCSLTSGSITIPKDVSIGYLAQSQDEHLSGTVYDEMYKAKKYITDIELEMRELEDRMGHLEGEELTRALSRYNRLQTKYDRDNGYAAESQITGVLTGLGFDKSDYERPVSSLSGGQKMRIALGRILLSSPDIIMLDEPTNHLDIQSITWLEEYLSSYKGSIILVSHDRYFIDRTASRILEIEAGRSTMFKGSYSFYSTEKRHIREAMQKAYMNQQAEIAHEEAVISKLKQFNREKSIKRAESREKVLSRIERLDKPVTLNTDMKLRLTPSNESGTDVLTVRGLSKAFGENELFTGLDLDIKRGEHTALIGANGTGKTTILKILNRKESKDGGTIRLGAGVKIGYFDQEHKDLNPDKTVFEEISDSFPEMNNTLIRNTLAAFLFIGDDVFKKIDDLSGGEQSRVSLAKLMLSPANFLILDEPTNHLDIQSKEILEDALSAYEGTLLYVSHDRFFISSTANRIIELRSKVLTDYRGGYDHYMSRRDEDFALQHPEISSDTPALTGMGFSKITERNLPEEPALSKGSSKEDYIAAKAMAAAERKAKSDLKKAEDRIASLETRKEEIEKEMSDPSIGTDLVKLTGLSKEHEKISAELDSAYSVWEKLSEAYS